MQKADLSMHKNTDRSTASKSFAATNFSRWHAREALCQRHARCIHFQGRTVGSWILGTALSFAFGGMDDEDFTLAERHTHVL